MLFLISHLHRDRESLNYIMGIIQCCTGCETIDKQQLSATDTLDEKLKQAEFAFPNGCVFKEDDTIQYFVKNWQLKNDITGEIQQIQPKNKRNRKKYSRRK